MKAYNNLAHAIILQAITDYKEAHRKNNEKEKLALIKFFESDWYYALTTVDSNIVLDYLEDWAAEYDSPKSYTRGKRCT